MAFELRDNLILYHRYEKSEAIIRDLTDNIITIELNKPIQNKSVLKLPYNSFGEFLFFRKEDIDLPIEELAKKSEYTRYKNREILKVEKRNREIQQKKSLYDSAVKQSAAAYHFTNYEDFIRIIQCGKLLCRTSAQKAGASFSHNTQMSESVLHNTDIKISDFARLAICSAAPAYTHFYIENSRGGHVSCRMQFSIFKILVMQNNQVRICEKVATNFEKTSEISTCKFEKQIQLINEILEYPKAELLVYHEVPISLIEEVMLYYPNNYDFKRKNLEVAEIESLARIHGFKLNRSSFFGGSWG